MAVETEKIDIIDTPEGRKEVSTIDGYWDVVTKDADDNPVVTRAYKHSTKERPADPELGELTFVSQAAPTRITPTRRRQPTRPDKLSLVLGDAQIGFRGEEEFHDEKAMALAQVAIRELMPDEIIFVGDMLDLAPMSRFEQRGDWANSTQRSIDRYHNFLAETRANAPNSKIIAISGNHELRMDKMIRKDAAELLHLKRANAEKELAVLTLSYLVRFDDLEVIEVDGYPNATYWLNDNLKATHGTNVAKGGSNAAKYLRDSDTGTLFGHTHRVELAHRTMARRDGYKKVIAASPGALSRITGHVPGFNYSVDAHNNTVPKAEDWQNGLILVEHSEANEDVTTAVMHIDQDEASVRIHGKKYAL